MTDDQDLAAKADALTGAVAVMTDKVDQLARQDRRRRGPLVVLALSVVLDLALSAGFFFALHGTNEAQDRTARLVEQVARASDATRAACLASNNSATKQHQLWEGVIALTPDDDETDPDVTAAFLVLLDETFVQQNCDAGSPP